MFIYIQHLERAVPEFRTSIILLTFHFISYEIVIERISEQRS